MKKEKEGRQKEKGQVGAEEGRTWTQKEGEEEKEKDEKKEEKEKERGKNKGGKKGIRESTHNHL